LHCGWIGNTFALAEDAAFEGEDYGTGGQKNPNFFHDIGLTEAQSKRFG
jgi:hypothetical protein